MGFDCGFDIYPRLEANGPDKEAYRKFVEEIVKKYGDMYDKKGRRSDGKILTTTADESVKSVEPDNVYFWFMIGECPHIPKSSDHCEYFLRFSSKVSGRLTAQAEPYIEDVYKIAQKYFGSRVKFWHELNEFGDEKQQFGYYHWNEVYDADKKLRGLNTEAPQVLA